MEYLDTVGLAEYADYKIHEISGGQQQRVALVRSLITCQGNFPRTHLRGVYIPPLERRSVQDRPDP